ncbi:MAG TPA: tetratricopeptide repeat protein [Ramlibacter sp.]
MPARRLLQPLAVPLLAAVLAACATRPPAEPVPDALARADAAFGLRELPQVDAQALFALPPDLRELLQRPELRGLSSGQRLNALLDAVFGADRKRFGYGSEQSTPAAQTWANRRGDCLSLTILTYATARALGLDAQMQEVRVPAVYERRAGIDFVNRHVNVAVRLRNRSPIEDVLQMQTAVIDFEPLLTGGERGRPLGEAAVLARFYNNLGSQALAAGDTQRAYGLYRAAIAADPLYGAAHGNLALLLQQRGLPAEAERLLRRAVALGDQPDVALASLHQLLVDQKRTAEAEAVAAQLRAAQDADPYHWISRGVAALNEGQNRQAVADLEHAQELTSGFTEVHGWLALAYWRMGEARRAREQLAQLEALQSGSALAGKLRRKLTATP